MYNMVYNICESYFNMRGEEQGWPDSCNFNLNRQLRKIKDLTLNDEKQSCCTCGTLFSTIFWRSMPNNHVEFPYLRLLRQREPVTVKSFILCLYLKNYSCQASESTLRLVSTTQQTWNDRITLNLTPSSILMWSSRCCSRRNFSNSLTFNLLRVFMNSQLQVGLIA